MIRNTNTGRRALAVAAVLAVVGVFGLVHATLGLYQTPGTQYVGHWVWNDADTNTSEVDVRVKVPCARRTAGFTPQAQPCVRNLKVEVTGVLSDGSSQTKSALVQVPEGFIRQVTIPFDHQLTQLTFIKILSLGVSSTCAPV